MLSHDLRSPLQTIQMTAKYLRQLDTDDDVGQAAARLINSGERMQRLLDELVDFNRTELGLGIRITPADADMAAVCADELDQIRAAHPGSSVELEVAGCRGSWDVGRVQQLLNNLVVNAIHYGDAGGTTRVAVHGNQSEVRITVANSKRPIDRETLVHIFNPLRRGHNQARANESGLGLGLYSERDCEGARRKDRSHVRGDADGVCRASTAKSQINRYDVTRFAILAAVAEPFGRKRRIRHACGIAFPRTHQRPATSVSRVRLPVSV
jgi:light-regulated signal transduction histidine kinase (bacteriophytochrome)